MSSSPSSPVSGSSGHHPAPQPIVPQRQAGLSTVQKTMALGVAIIAVAKGAEYALFTARAAGGPAWMLGGIALLVCGLQVVRYLVEAEQARQNEVATLRGQLNGHNVQQLRLDNAALQAQLDAASQEIAHIARVKAQKQRALDDIQQQSARLRQALRDDRATVQAKEQRIMQLRQELRAMGEGMMQERRRVEALGRENAHLQGRVQEAGQLADALEAARKAKEQELAELQTEHADTEHVNADLLRSVLGHRERASQREQLEQQVDALTQSVQCHRAGDARRQQSHMCEYVRVGQAEAKAKILQLTRNVVTEASYVGLVAGGLGSWASQAVFGDDQPFKAKLHELIMEQAIVHLGREYGFSIDFDDADQIDTDLDLLLGRLIADGRLNGRSNFELFQEVGRALLILFNKHPDHKGSTPGDRRRALSEKLSQIVLSDQYRLALATNPKDPAIRILYLLAEGLVKAPLWEHFDQVIGDIVAERGAAIRPPNPTRNTTTTTTSSNSSGAAGPLSQKLSEAVGAQVSAVKNKDAKKWDMPKLRKNALKAGAQVGVFDPNQGTNYFSALYHQVFQKDGSPERRVEVLRMGSPTVEVLGQPVEIIGPFLLWLDFLRAEGKGRCHAYFGHQRMAKEGKDGREGFRSQRLELLSREYPGIFYFFNLPMDEAFFKQEGPDVSGDDFIRDTLAAMAAEDKGLDGYTNPAGFHFPREFLATKGINCDQILHDIMHEVRDNFFPADKFETLNRDQRQAFLLIAYTRIETHFSLLLGASRNSTCKDGIDRAAVVNALCYYLDLVYAGKHKDPAELERFSVIFHHAAMMVKAQAVIPGRWRLLKLCLEHFESMGPALDRISQGTNPEGYRLQTVEIPHVTGRNLRKDRLAVGREDFLKAVDRETAADRHHVVADFLNNYWRFEGADLRDRKVQVTVGDNHHDVPFQTHRDIGAVSHTVNLQPVAFAADPSTGDKAHVAATTTLFARLLALTEGDEGMAWKLMALHNQKPVVGDISVPLMQRYRYAPGDGEQAEQMLRFHERQVDIEAGEKKMAASSQKLPDGSYRVKVIGDFEISSKIPGDPRRIVRATLVITLRSEAGGGAAAAAASRSDDDDDDDRGKDRLEESGPVPSAPDAILTWDVFVSDDKCPPLT